MPHFCFHVYDGEGRAHFDDVNLPDSRAARLWAIGLVGKRIAASDQLRLPEGWHLDVTDDRGQVVFEVNPERRAMQ